MKRFKDCVVRCKAGETSVQLLNAIKNECQRKHYKVEVNSLYGFHDTLVVYMENSSLPFCRIILSAISEYNEVRVSNIVPSSESGLMNLDYDLYNSILDYFTNDVIRQIIKQNGNDYSITSDTYYITEIIPQSYGKLLNWLNHYPLSGHLDDEQRWFSFMTTLRKNAEELDGETLGKFLEEYTAWSKTTIDSYAEKFNEQLRLLEYYESHR